MIRLAFLLFLLLPTALHAQPSEFATTIGDLSVVKLYPVIFTQGMGFTTRNEYEIPTDGATISLEVAAAPIGFKLLDANWQPYDNLAAIGSYAQIVVGPGNDSTHLLLTAKPYPATHARLRLVITAIYVRDPRRP